jgi:protein O-GlcNAc transferase
VNLESTSAAEAAYQQALALHRSGRLADAWALYQNALQLHQGHSKALHQLGVIALQTNHPEIGVELIGKAILLDPRSAVAHVNYGRANHQLQRYSAALASYDTAIALQPGFADAYNNRGIALAAMQSYEAAAESYDKAIALKPDHADAYNNRGAALSELKRYDAAIHSYDKAVALDSRHAIAFNNRGNAQCELKQYEAALASYERATALEPGYVDAYNNYGNALRELKRYVDAVAGYDKAIALNPGHADAHCNRGDALRDLKQFAAAVASYDKGIACFDKAAALNYKHAIAFNNRGNVLGELRRYDAAIASYDEAIALKSDYADAYNNRGGALGELRRYEAAIASYGKAIAFKPDFADAYANRGNVFRETKQFESALADYDEALVLNPDFKFLRGMRLYTKLQICDWRDLEMEVAQLVARIERDEAVANPLCVLALSGSAALQLKAAEICVEEQCPLNPALPAVAGARSIKHDKIRIGYFSADLRDHPVSILAAELFEIHDRSRFELTAFSFGPDTQDPMRRRLENTFDRFIDVRTDSDEDIARLARSMEIDIAVDLGGFTQGCRPGIFAMRAAPLQVSYLGYAGTMGAEYIDYLIGDATVVPEADRSHYWEKIIYLPHSYLPNDSRRGIAEKVFTREELGLPESGFVFCCFNNSYKIAPQAFDGWMRILRQVEASVLWLSAVNPTAAGNLRQEAIKRGVGADRVIFAKRAAALPEHLARHRAADLFLDTLPYNAHTTAIDALWAGLPVLTHMGDTFAGRVAASLLKAIQLPELIAPNQERYEQLAVELATHARRLAELRDKLAENRLTTPLFDTRLFAKNLEAAYSAIHARYQDGLPTEHIFVT